MSVRIVEDRGAAPVPQRPRHDDEAQAQRTDPRGPLIDSLTNLRNAIIPVAVLVFTREADTAFFVGAIAAAVLIPVSMVFAYLAWSRLTFRMGEHDIKVESGLLSRKARSVPYERVQDIAFEEKPLARLLGLVALTFETGAGAGEDLKLAYLSRAQAEALRAQVRDRRRGLAPTSIQSEEAEADQLLFAMNARRILLLGLFSFSLIAIPVAGGFFAQYDEVLPFDLWDIEDWQTRLAGPGAYLNGLGVAAQAIGIAVLVLALLMVGTLTGIVRTALREWGFRLTRTDNGLKRVRGMMTRTMAVLPVRRVQAAIVSTGLVRAHFGWHDLGLVSLAADSGGAHHEVAPLARESEVRALIDEVGLQWPDDVEWHRIDPRHIVLQALWAMRWWLGVAAAGGLAQHFLQPPNWTASPWLPLAAVALALLSGVRTYRALQRTHYALTDHYIYKRGGWWARHLYCVPREKLHGAALATGPLDRRLGLAELQLGLAGAGLFIPGLPVERAQALRENLLAAMKLRDFSAIN